MDPAEVDQYLDFASEGALLEQVQKRFPNAVFVYIRDCPEGSDREGRVLFNGNAVFAMGLTEYAREYFSTLVRNAVVLPQIMEDNGEI